MSDGHQLELRGGTSLAYTELAFDDFVLELQYRVIGSGPIRAAVQVRSELQADSRHVSGLQVVWDETSPRESRVIRRRSRRTRVAGGDVGWHRLRVECVAECVSVYRNNHLVQRIRGTARRSGLLALAACGDRRSSVAFRAIVVTELNHRLLFNGRDLQGWVGADDEAAKCWEVHDGKLVCTGAAGPWLRTEEQFGDFNLRLEYKLKEGGNSGVYVRVPADGRHHGAGAGIEVQILDDASARYAKLKPYQFTGSLYAIVPARPGTARPAGKWNTLEIECRGTHYRVTHNGVHVIETSASEVAEVGQRLTAGYLGLQNHSETVWFRNIRIAAADGERKRVPESKVQSTRRAVPAFDS